MVMLAAVHAQLVGAQLHQLHALNSQLQQQMAEQQRQAVLAQILYETEQVARRVWATGKSDPFAAAVHAETWLQGVQSVAPQMFSDIGAKRAWSSAVDTMNAASATLRRDAAAAALLDGYRAAETERQRLLSLVSGDPAGEMQKRTEALQSAETRLSNARTSMFAFCGLSVVAAGLCVLLIVIGSAADATAMAVIGGLGIIPSIVIVFIAWSLSIPHFLKRRAAVPVAASALEEAKRVCAALDDFARNPAGGVLLARVAADHPLIAQAPPASAFEQVAPSSVVERQTVVIRCQYCGNLTPVDLQGCQHCGARLK